MGRHSSDDSEEEEVSGSELEDQLLSSSEEELVKSRRTTSSKKSSKRSSKKSKKSRRHNRRESTSEDTSSEEETEWVVVVREQPSAGSKPTTSSSDKKDNSNADGEIFKRPKLDEIKAQTTPVELENDDDEEWMGFNEMLPTYSNDSRKAERRRKKREEKRCSRSIDTKTFGQYVNELNPYWKDGGCGLPEEFPSPAEDAKPVPSSSPKSIGDGGLCWLRKFFMRAKEQAKEPGRNLEDIVSERYGSLENFLGLLDEAEKKSKQRERERDHGSSSKPKGDRDRRDSRFIQPRRDSDDDDEDYSSSRNSSYSSRHKHDRHRDRRRSRERECDSRSSWRKRKSPEERSTKSSTSSTSTHCKRSPKIHVAITATALFSKNSNQDREVSPAISPNNIQTFEEEGQPQKDIPKTVLTDIEMNELGAKLLKAEILGNMGLVEQLKNKISEAERTRKNGGDISGTKNMETKKIVTKVAIKDTNRDRGRRRVKDKIVETHKDGQRVRYFPDDDKYTLKNMFQKEKMNTAADENALFARLAGKNAKTGFDYDADDVFTDKASSSKQVAKEQEREVRDVLYEEKQYKRILDTCPWCLESSVVEKHLILSVADKSYLCVPPYQSLTEGHCLIVPMSHVSSATELDEDVWCEMQKFRKALVKMFREADQDMVIFETALFLKRHPHMVLECIPIPKETGELAPIYFKKAIQECETEWSHNKKLVDLRHRDVRRAVPKGLPYFSVDFGDASCGFAHVVEDERKFPNNFAHEIVGGMMELDHHLWRKKRRDDFKTQRTKVMDFLKLWGAHDWTRDLSK